MTRDDEVPQKDRSALLRDNRLAHTIVAKFQASIRDPRDKSSEKGFWREKQKQCRFKYKWTNARNIASTTRKNLSHLTCFNSDKKVYYTIVSRAKEEQRHLRRLVTVLVTSALKRLTWTVSPQKGSVHPVPYHFPRKIRVDSGGEVNTIHPTFAKKLGLWSLECLLTLWHRKLTAPRWVPMEW